MKKFYKTLVPLFCSLVLLSSCDSDSYKSMVLSGDWYGNFGAYYAYEYANGRVEYFDSYESQLQFTPSYYYSDYGYGYEVDWYRTGPYRYQSMRFEYKVLDGNIYLHFPYNEDWDAVISDYRLTSYYFSGYFNGGKERFQLRKLTDDFDWNEYYGYNYHYGIYDNWRAPYKAPADSIEHQPNAQEAGRVIKHGYRLPAVK